MLSKQDQTIEEIKHMRSDTIERFDRLDTKYGKISKTLEELKDALVAIASRK